MSKNWFRQLCALGLGALSSFAMQPYEFWPVLLLGLSGFWLLLTMTTTRIQPWVTGFMFGFGYFVAGLWWVGNALLVDNNPYYWALPFAVFGLQALLAFFPMMGAGMARSLFPGRGLSAYFAFVSLLSFWEWGRGHMFTGFPWNLFAMTWTGFIPMTQIISIGGVYFLNFLTIFVLTLPAFLWKGDLPRRQKIILGVSAIILLGINSVWGFDRLNRHPTAFNTDVIVQVVTPNIPQGEKWSQELLVKNFYKTVDMLRQQPSGQRASGSVRVLVLPETALMPEVFNSEQALNALQTALRYYPEKTYLLSGAFRREELPDGTNRYFNSFTAMDKSGRFLGWFDKFHLVPFGEYMPFQKYIPFGPVAKFAGFQGGKGPETWNTLEDVPAFSPLICYEAIFAGRVTADTRPKWMVNVTNDAWYGVSPGPYQHLAQTQFRAIEEGLPMVRSTNTGISSVIDPVGRILLQSPLYVDFVQESNLPRPLEKPTIYAVYKDILFFACLAFFLLTSIFTRRPRP